MISSVGARHEGHRVLEFTKAGGMLASELQRRSGVEKSVVSRIITALQGRGLRPGKDPKTEHVRSPPRRVPWPSLCATWRETGLLEGGPSPCRATWRRVTGESIQRATS